MEDMIKRIVEMDQKAQAITGAAQAEKQKAEQEIAAQTEQLRQQYLERARKRIAENAVKERAAAEEAWANQAEMYRTQQKLMDALYETHREEWVRTITDAVIGG